MTGSNESGRSVKNFPHNLIKWLGFTLDQTNERTEGGYLNLNLI